jgi:hypothetical protein
VTAADTWPVVAGTDQGTPHVVAWPDGLAARAGSAAQAGATGLTAVPAVQPDNATPQDSSVSKARARTGSSVEGAVNPGLSGRG